MQIYKARIEDDNYAVILGLIFEIIQDYNNLSFLAIKTARKINILEAFRLSLQGANIKVSEFDKHQKTWEYSTKIVKSLLGINTGISSLSLFLTPTGSSTPSHYDHCDVLLIQLFGNKFLEIQSKRACDNPTVDTLVDDKNMEFDFKCNLLRNDIVYIPSGHIHRTRGNTLSGTLGICLSTG